MPSKDAITAKIQEVIKLYKKDFARVDRDERYKWVAVKHFQDNWEKGNPDFHAMLVNALLMHENLLQSGYYFAHMVVIEFARQEPDTVQALFAMLYNESLPLEGRIIDFQKSFEPFIKRQYENDEKWKKSFQDLRAISVYLTFRYPEKYYFYKWTVYRNFAKHVEFPLNYNRSEEYAKYTELCEMVRDTVLKDDELTVMSRNRLLGEDCCKDSAYRILATDIMYFWNWLKREEKKKTTVNPVNLDKGHDNLPRYWLYSQGRNAEFWDDFRKAGIIGIGLSEMGDLRNYDSKAVIKEIGYGKNDAHCCWQFVHEMKPDDIVYVKKGLNTLIGRGEITGSYQYEPPQFIHRYKNIRTVKWTHNGTWEYPAAISGAIQTPQKTLTDITSYTDLIQNMENSFFETAPIVRPIEPQNIEKYDSFMFLDDVFMSNSQFDTLTGLLKHYKNLILQGAPGVGKTYAARRLAWAMMGEKDESRIQFVQFHQSYSYEDFIMGFRPTKDGFELKHGAFYEFCKIAEEDDENDYFFIIDEINRGNLSKIFGELLMLIENDKRGESTRLLYNNEQFNVPKNLYIIGMMNTADRSLALIDYALRRRFAFFDMEPAFETDSFGEHQEEVANEKYDSLIDVIRELNNVITADPLLGKGYRVGHDRFCKYSYNDAQLNEIVEYHLIPLLHEYWADEPTKVSQWIKKLRGALNGG